MRTCGQLKIPGRTPTNSTAGLECRDLTHLLSRPIVAMRVVVVVTRSHVSLLVAMLVDVISIMVSIAAVAACDSYGCHQH
jgi:hypothetical protein